MIISANRFQYKNPGMSLMLAENQNSAPKQASSVIVKNFGVVQAEDRFAALGCGYVISGEEINLEIPESTIFERCYISSMGIHLRGEFEVIDPDLFLRLSTDENGYTVIEAFKL